MTNIHGLKLKAKGMTRMLAAEEAKPSDERNFLKIQQLQKAKNNCKQQIKRMKRARSKGEKT